MHHKKASWLPVLLIPLVIIIVFSVWSSTAPLVSWAQAESDDATFDMRGFDFDNELVSLSRIVEYVPDVFLTPEEFDARDDIQLGTVPYEARVCTMRIRILVPEGRMYGIGGYSTNYASSVYINGDWLFDEGKPALTGEEEESSESYRLFSAAPQDGVIEIVIQTSAFANIDTSTNMGWFVGDYELSRVFFTRKTGVDIMVIAVYATLAVISLLLFLVLPSYKANGWLALLALVYVVRSGLKTTKILLTLLPFFDWPTVYITERITDPLTVILLTLILHSAFPGALPKWLRAITIGGGAAWALAFLVLPWQTFLGKSGLMNQIVFAVLGVLFVFILWSLRRTRPTLAQVVMLVGVGLALYAFIYDADYFGHWQLPIFNFSFSLTAPMLIVFTMCMLVASLLATMQKTTQKEVLLAQTVEEQKLELMDARVATMLSQIQPHFMYNTLSSIIGQCDGKPEAQNSLLTFSEYLRGNMASLTQKRPISFADELEHTRQYLDLEQLRFEDRLTVVCDIQAEDFLLPVLTLQPIVENAVRHGLTRKEEGGSIVIRSIETATCFQIIVLDDGLGFDTTTPLDSSHVGITNVRLRLEAQCGGTLEIESTPGKGTMVTIELPKGEMVR